MYSYRYFSVLTKKLPYGVMLLVMPAIAETTSKVVPQPLQSDNGVHVSVEHNHSQSITLITGDIVVTQPAATRDTVAVIGGSTKEPVPFSSFVKNGHYFVVPDSARQLLNSGVLDIELFNLAKLQQYINTSEISSLQILVKYKPGSAPINFGPSVNTSYIQAIQTQVVTVNNSTAQTIWQLLVGSSEIKKVWLDEEIYMH